MNRWKSIGPWMIILVFTFYLAVFSGCESDSVVEVIEESEIDILKITCREPAPAPGETAVLSLQVTGQATVCPTYEWQVDGGTFLNGQNEGISVSWVAPETPGLYNFTCIGYLGDTPGDTMTHTVMVINSEEMDTGNNWSLAPRKIFGAIYFFASRNQLPIRNRNYLGMFCYKYITEGINAIVSETGEAVGGGVDLYIPEDGSCVTGSYLRNYFDGLSQQRLDTWIHPLAIGSPTNVSNDPGGLVLYRKNQHKFPFINQYCNKMVWEARLVGDSPDGTEDLSNIYYFESISTDTVHVTESHDSMHVWFGSTQQVVHRYYNNIMPTITPDDAYIVYFVDSTGVFEPCLVDIVGGMPDIGTRRALMVDEDDGIFSQAGISVSRNTIFQWNRTENILSFIDGGGDLCFLHHTTGTVQIIDGISGVTEFTWAPDETRLAAVTSEGIYLVSAAGVASSEPIYERELLTDDLIGLNWSASDVEPKLGFRMVRKGASSIDSWSVFVICYLDDGLTVFASKRIGWASAIEPMTKYTYMRCFFDEDDNVYMPVPMTTSPYGAECGIWYIYK